MRLQVHATAVLHCISHTSSQLHKGDERNSSATVAVQMDACKQHHGRRKRTDRPHGVAGSLRDHCGTRSHLPHLGESPPSEGSCHACAAPARAACAAAARPLTLQSAEPDRSARPISCLCKRKNESVLHADPGALGKLVQRSCQRCYCNGRRDTNNRQRMHNACLALERAPRCPGTSTIRTVTYDAQPSCSCATAVHIWPASQVGTCAGA